MDYGNLTISAACDITDGEWGDSDNLVWGGPLAHPLHSPVVCHTGLCYNCFLLFVLIFWKLSALIMASKHKSNSSDSALKRQKAISKEVKFGMIKYSENAKTSKFTLHHAIGTELSIYYFYFPDFHLPWRGLECNPCDSRGYSYCKCS